MGMFDFNPNNTSVRTSEGYTSAPGQLAYAGAGMMAKAVGKGLGFQDEEDLFKEIYENADMDTMEGRREVIKKVMAINPEKGRELAEQLNQVAQAEASTQSMELATQASKVANQKIQKGSIYVNKFKNDATPEGLGYAIQSYFITNGIDYDAAKPPTTLVQAQLLLGKLYKDDKTQLTIFRNGINKDVSDAQTLYVNKMAHIDAGVTQQVNDKIINNFDSEIETTPKDKTSPAVSVDDANLSPSFNFKSPDGVIHTDPTTAPEGQPFRGKKNGVVGIWTYQYIGGGYEEGFGKWTHRPDAAPTAYTGEDTIIYNGQTAGELDDSLYNNFI